MEKENRNCSSFICTMMCDVFLHVDEYKPGIESHLLLISEARLHSTASALVCIARRQVGTPRTLNDVAKSIRKSQAHIG